VYIFEVGLFLTESYKKEMDFFETPIQCKRRYPELAYEKFD